MTEKVSIIIPTYNRFKYLLKAVESAQNQTYKNIEIIIVNDGSSQEEYYTHRFEGCIVINMDINTKKRFGKASPGGFQRSIGMKIATGDYFAFLDDDDYWFPTKIAKQVEAMKKHNCKMSCTDGLFGKGIYDPNKHYRKYNKEHYMNIIKNIFNRQNKGHLMSNGFPLIWNEEFLNTHNCCIASSVIVHKNIVKIIGYFLNVNWAPDWEYWKRIIKFTDCVYLDEPLLHWDSGSGDGKLY
tara:strand:- start:5913 stop:6632 length:720 start_codon:yes stop_codon:yes gene_type:complete